MWDLSDTATWVRGNHTLNAGFNFRSWTLNRDLANEFLGAFNFSGDFTGNQVADMLLGYYWGPPHFSRRDSAAAKPATRANTTSSISRRTFRMTGKCRHD